MNNIFFNKLSQKIKNQKSFDTQNELWKIGFESALKAIELEILDNPNPV